jgi:hypothetical protein
MKYYAIYTIHNGERFYFEDGEGNVLVVRASTEDAAWNLFFSSIEEEYHSEIEENYEIEMFNSRYDMDFLYYVECKKEYPYFSKPKTSLKNGFKLVEKPNKQFEFHHY